MRMMTEQHENLRFQIELHLSEAKQNVVEIKRELDHKKRKVWPLLAMKITIEILFNGTTPGALSKNL